MYLFWLTFSNTAHNHITMSLSLSFVNYFIDDKFTKNIKKIYLQPYVYEYFVNVIIMCFNLILYSLIDEGLYGFSSILCWFLHSYNFSNDKSWKLLAAFQKVSGKCGQSWNDLIFERHITMDDLHGKL